MATHSSILLWRIPSTEEPEGRLQPMRLQRVGHDCRSNDWCPSKRRGPQGGTEERMMLSWRQRFDGYIYTPRNTEDLGKAPEVRRKAWGNFSPRPPERANPSGTLM